MRLKTLVLLAIAGTCGLVAMMGVQQVLSKNENDGKSEVVKVLVATAEILPGQALDEKNVEFKELPPQAIPEGAVTKAEQIRDRALKVRAFPGDLITAAKLDKKGARNVSSDVPKGMRAVSIPIDPTMTAAGLIRQGDKVDVLVTYRAPHAGRDVGIGKEIKTVLECIEVFTIDGQRDSTLMPTTPQASAQQIKNVSLLVNYEQAKLLKLAGGVGDLHLTLRGGNDDQQLDKNELFDPRIAEQAVAQIRTDERGEPRTVSQSEPDEKSEPDVKKWKIEIYEGPKLRIEEVDLPSEAGTAPTAAAERGQQPWMGSLRKMFGG